MEKTSPPVRERRKGAFMVVNNKTKAVHFVHNCDICGANAGFGYGSFLTRGIPGRWRCWEHRISKEQLDAEETERKAVEEAESAESRVRLAVEKFLPTLSAKVADPNPVKMKETESIDQLDMFA